ncbi:MAG: DUF2975 domain-containing protein [Cytophagales bacterium]|nr:MAG: DUF2975 domain-containing protein [Cytophagales bacterium]
MNTYLFKSIVSVLYWICNFLIALIAAAGLFSLFLHLVGSSNGNFYVNQMNFKDFNSPTMKIPVSVDLRSSLIDTTILFRSKDYTSQPELYQIEKEFDTTDRYFENNNKAILGRQNAGLLSPTDTLTSTLALVAKNQATEAGVYANVSTPEQVKGFVKVRIGNLKNGWLIVTLNWLEVVLRIAIWLFILVKINLLLQEVRKYQIFTAQNFRRLRWVGIGLLAAWLVDGVELLRQYVLGSELGRTHLSFNSYKNGQLVYPAPFNINMDYTTNFDITDLLVALSVIVLAEIFRKGFELQQEQDLTI